MAIARKIGSGTLFALAALTCLLCLAGVFGAWVGKATVDQTSLAAIDLVAGYLGLAGQVIENVDGGLAEVERTVGTVRQGAESLQAEGAGSPVALILQRTVGEDLLPRLDRLTTMAARLQGGLSSLSETIARLNRMPFVSLPPVSDDLVALDARIAEAAAQARELRGAVEALDGSRILAASERVDDRVASARASLASVQQRITATQSVLADISASLTVWSTVGAGALTLLLIIFAVGQASLAYLAWGWMRAEG